MLSVFRSEEDPNKTGFYRLAEAEEDLLGRSSSSDYRQTEMSRERTGKTTSLAAKMDLGRIDVVHVDPNRSRPQEEDY